jgi:stage V sporulation protein G
MDVRVYPLDDPKGGTKAFANVAVDDMVAIRGIRVVEGEKGLFISMPQSQDKKEKYHDIAFPLTGKLRDEMAAAVLAEYDRVAALAPEQRVYETPDKGAASAKSAADVKLDIRVYRLEDPQRSTKAFASVSMDDKIAIRGVRVVEGARGTFVVMPQSKHIKDGETKYHDVAFPLSGDVRRQINKAILAEYKEPAKAAEKSLAEGLKQGAERAAQQGAASRQDVAKSRHGAEIGA